MQYLPYVNIKQGSKSVPRFSNGNTLPLTQMPFGMVSFVPQTQVDRGSWFFHPDDRSLEGIRLSHQPSPWIGDYGCFVLLPQRERPLAETWTNWSSYRPQEAKLNPDYLNVNFLRYRTQMTISPTERGAAIELDYRGEEQAVLSILPVGGEMGHRVDAENGRVYGYTTYHSLDIAKNFKTYYVMEFDTPIIADKTLISLGSNSSIKEGKSIEGEKAGIHIVFDGKKVTGRVAISYISEEQAILNLEQELIGKTYEQVHAQAEEKWESYLSRIEVETETEEQMRTFYSCMYRSFLFPHKAYEYDAQGNPIHYSPDTGKVYPGVRYTDNGFWDTYRTVYPLYSLIAKEEYAEMLEGFVNDYVYGGWLPRWISTGAVNCMPSTLIDAVIADAAVKGLVSNELLEKALEGMLKHANEAAPDARNGRNGVKAYLEHGYVPYDLEGESVNLTLDAAYGDFCIAEVAKVLGKTEIEEEYRARAKNYRHLFDAETGFMRARDSKGEFRPNFDPYTWGRDYTESSAFPPSFFVPHDVAGLVELYGGKEKFLQKLDELFAAEPRFNVGGYGGEIHEMSEMAAVDFGQCAISNQPSFHIPYLYSAVGEQEKTDYWVKKICDELFTAENDGFPGDEDNGTMAAWYVFSSLGLYPLCPGKNEYVRSTSLVKNARIKGIDLETYLANMNK
ncbi:GH92 family glycosyl hydrolase [Bacillus niameyensis]|uniref:GH92 family glycosyl hydrolase n=1 Tax=Bacillus niameyensis TaxID=1522308 RepID=UPI0007843E8C|nr:GH92 family glycosyl hydrolase [Bacillus niameyensis]